MKDREDNPKVTIVIPVYNGANYLKYAIESALAQTYKNLEIMVVDDGSKDNTEEIASAYSDRIRYIKKKNGGVSSALNLAIREMTGDYFSWLSHDDTYEPQKIEREIEVLRERNALYKKVIVFSDYYLINEKGKIITESRKDHEEIVKKPEYALIKGHVNGLSLLIPKMAFDECGNFDEKMVCVQDYEMWRRIFKKYKIIHIPEILVSTRWHKEQTTHTSPLVEVEGNKFFIETIEEVPRKRRIALEGSEYAYYREIARFHRGTVYDKTSKYCDNKADEIFERAKNKAKNVKVSVVIPFYNRSEEVVRAINSALCQSHKNLEIILVDDGSSLKHEAVDEVAKKDKRIKLIRLKKNSGVSVARQTGLEAASGDYVAFLDSDDEFLPDKIETQLVEIIANEAKISHTSYYREEDGESKIINSGKQTGKCCEELMGQCLIATPTVMIDLSEIRKMGIKFDEKMKYGEDVCFWLGVLKNDGLLVGVDKPLATVHVNKQTAAYDIDKQLVGLKGILNYLINDDYYSQINVGLAKLMEGFIELTKKQNIVQEPTVRGNKLQKLKYYIEREGAKNAIVRVKKKVKTVFS